MAEKLRAHFPGAFYHIIARGNRRPKILLDDKREYLFIDDAYFSLLLTLRLSRASLAGVGLQPDVKRLLA
ncbi:MAG: hypothetical protein ACFFCW_17300 [Candidatus Hodarchaeota archaeon]